MKHLIITAFSFLLFAMACKAQTGSKTNLNAVSFELGKTGMVGNLTFDHRFVQSNLGFRVGMGSNFSKYLPYFTTGAGGYYLFGKTKKYLELGIDVSYVSVGEVSDDQRGFNLFYPNYPIKTYYSTLNIGYRRYGKRTLFRFGFSPGFTKDDFLPGGYISYGFTF